MKIGLRDPFFTKNNPVNALLGHLILGRLFIGGIMSKLACNVRDMSLKTKKLRRDGFVPGNLVGKNLDHSIAVIIESGALSHEMKGSTVSSQLTLDIDGTEYDAVIKSLDYAPMSNKIQHIEFQALTVGETVKTSVALNFINGDKIEGEGNLQEYVHSIDYEVLPKDMLESLDVDISGLTLGKDIKVEDLDFAKDERYNVLTAMNVSLISFSAIHEVVLETEDTDEVAPEVVE